MRRTKYGKFQGNSQKEKDTIKLYMDELLKYEKDSSKPTNTENVDVKNTENDTADTTVIVEDNSLGDRYLAEYNDAVRKDKEMYITLFGSDEEKAQLKKEAADLLHKEKTALLEAEEAQKLAEEIKIKEASLEVLKEKEELRTALREKLSFVRKDYATILENFDKIKAIDTVYWTVISENPDEENYIGNITDLIAGIRSLKRKISDIGAVFSNATLEDLKNYPIDKVINDLKKEYRKHLVFTKRTATIADKVKERHYDIKKTALIDKNLMYLLSSAFNLLSKSTLDMPNSIKTLINGEYTSLTGETIPFKVSLKEAGTLNVMDVDFSLIFQFDALEITDFGCTTEINSYRQQFNIADFRAQQLTPEFEQFFVEAIPSLHYDFRRVLVMSIHNLDIINTLDSLEF